MGRWLVTHTHRRKAEGWRRARPRWSQQRSCVPSACSCWRGAGCSSSPLGLARCSLLASNLWMNVQVIRVLQTKPLPLSSEVLSSVAPFLWPPPRHFLLRNLFSPFYFFLVNSGFIKWLDTWGCVLTLPSLRARHPLTGNAPSFPLYDLIVFKSFWPNPWMCPPALIKCPFSKSWTPWMLGIYLKYICRYSMIFHHYLRNNIFFHILGNFINQGIIFFFFFYMSPPILALFFPIYMKRDIWPSDFVNFWVFLFVFLSLR